MKLALAQEMRNIDKLAINDFGVPEIVLMENASREIARGVEDMLSGDLPIAKVRPPDERFGSKISFWERMSR